MLLEVGNEDEIKLYNKLSGITNGMKILRLLKEGLENIKRIFSNLKNL